jgi:flagellar assembly protein FliH
VAVEMMLSFRHVLKHQTVNYDAENKVVIEVGAASDSEIYSESDEHDPHKKEHDAQKSAARITRHAESQAEEILSNARRDAINEQEVILKSARDEAEKIISEARDKGYSEGMERAHAEGELIKEEAQQVLDDALAECEEIKANLEPEIIEMIISITEKLLGNITEVNPKIILNLVKQGFAAAAISGDVVVHVSSDDYDAVFKNKDELLAHTDGSVNLKIKKDLSLSPMDCVIETEFGDIDCSLSQQFESLKASLTYILNNK